jgi:hypothetical protein
MNFLTNDQITFNTINYKGVSHDSKISFITRRLACFIIKPNWHIKYAKINYKFDSSGYKAVLVSQRDGTTLYIKGK